MMTSTARRAFVTVFGAAATMALALGVAGCGGGDSKDSVVMTEPGTKPPVASPPSLEPIPASAARALASSTTADAEKTATPAPAAGKAEGWGTLKGQVVFGGNAPPEEILVPQGQAPKNPEVCAKNAPIKSEKLVVDGATKGVKNALVYLTRVDPASVNPDAKAAAAKADVFFDQKNCIFEPHVLAIMAGAKIELKSSDPVNHNINVRFRANALFNKLLAANAQQPYSPPAAERQPTQVTCDIHNWMEGYWMVLDHPYFAVTDAKGNFEIKNVPAGPQKVVVWQEAAKYVTAASGDEVTITANDVTSQNFTIDPNKIKK